MNEPGCGQNALGTALGMDAAEQPGAGRKLLLVDDDAPLRRSLTRALERRGFVVLPAEGLAEGRMLAREHRPEFAVLDMRLAEGSGLDLLKTLRDLRPEIRIVIVTGYGNIATAVVAIKAGAPPTIWQSRSTPTTWSPPFCAPARVCLPRATTRCPRIACAGSTSSGCSSSATATSPRPRAASTCTAARCSASSTNAPHANEAAGRRGLDLPDSGRRRPCPVSWE